jgi:glycyl-tRNA synthetase beta chain
MADFLLELLSEEIPARMQAKAKEDLARLFTEALAKAGLAAGSIETFATPRRLALIAKGLPLETEAVAEETKGPKVGAPPQAMEGFLRKVGLTQDKLVERDGVFFAVVNKPGRKTADVLAEAIPAIIRAFPWPKSMRWGAASLSTESLRWVRPLQGIVALLGDDVVPCEVEGITSGRETMGHRFHSSGPISIANADTYVETLRAAHVIVHFSERCTLIREGAEAAAKAAGLVLVADEGLVAENAGLTEWPVPMLGRFDPAFLAVPEEVIQLTARVNQKYFICRDGAGKLANAFVCTANIIASDGGAVIVAGNEKVLAARLSDAKFFWEQDLKVRLDDQAAKLSNIVFHEKLGTVADKVERVAKLARWLVEEGIVKSSPERGGGGEADGGAERSQADAALVDSARPLRPSGAPPRSGEDLAAMAERAARLCKADLVTGMVGEFPELQGIMGGYYARAQGESDAVADAIRDHYKPVGQGDDVPTAPVTVAVSLADKLDTLVAMFIASERATGSKDPFALRRQGLSSLALIAKNDLRLPFDQFLNLAKHLTVFLPVIMLQLSDSKFRDEFAKLWPEFPRALEAGMISKRLEDIKGRNPDSFSFLLSYMNSTLEPVFALTTNADENAMAVFPFIIDRLKVQQREAGVRHDLIDAVFALGGEDDLVRLLARVKALQSFITTDEGTNLLAGYKRAANILKSSPERGGGGEADGGGGRSQTDAALGGEVPAPPPLRGSPPRSGEDLVERDLEEALDAAEPRATAGIAAEDFETAMAALASLRSPIDAFFDGVMVNDPDPEKRAYRLGLLARFRDAVHAVADFSKIEG